MDVAGVSVLGVVLGAVLCGALGLLVPRLISAVPEPEPEPETETETETELKTELETELETDSDEDPGSEPSGAVAEKELYADIAAAPHLAGRSLVICALVGALIGGAVGLQALGEILTSQSVNAYRASMVISGEIPGASSTNISTAAAV